MTARHSFAVAMALVSGSVFGCSGARNAASPFDPIPPLDAAVSTGEDTAPVFVDTTAGGDSPVRINELSAADDRVELINPSDAPAALGGLWLADGGYVDGDADHRVDLTGTLTPGERRVLVGGTDFPFGLGAADSLTLNGPNGALDTTSWVDPAADVSWCRLPDGAGAFQACAATFGAVNTSAAPPGRLTIVELTSSGDDTIELLNAGGSPLSAAGYWLSDGGFVEGAPDAADHRFDLDPSRTFAPGERWVLVGGQDHLFGLGKADSLALNGPDGVVEQTSWVEPEAAVSWCRLPEDAAAFQPCAATFGAPNTPALAGKLVINELTASGDDTIELLNIGGSPVALGGYWIADGGYVAEAADAPDHRFDLDALGSLAPGERVVLTSGVEHPFGLGQSDSLSLFDPYDALVDTTSWDGPDAATSWCRTPDGTGAFAACAAASFGQPNP